MKQFSVKARVTLFYSAILIFVVAVAGAILLIATNTQVQTITSETLEKTVKDAEENIAYYDDRIEIEPDFDFYQNGVTIILYGARGTPLAGSSPDDFPSATPLVSDQVQSVVSDDQTWIVYDLYLRHPNSSGIWLRGIYSMQNDLVMLQAIYKIVWIGLPLLILLAILGGYVITRRAFRPLVRICAETQQISNGSDLSKRLPVPRSQDEFHTLTEILNGMFTRLESAFENERQFSSDVSHELRTPTAIILSQCDYCLSSPRKTAQYRESLEAIRKQGRRMAALIAQLLELSRTTDAESRLEKEVFVLAELCESVAEEMQLRADEKQIQIHTALDHSLQIYADQMQILRLLVNLVSNAIQYGNPGGRVDIHLSRSDTDAEITVSDNGIGIPNEKLHKIFYRFYKVDPSREQKEKDQDSFGLGLSYVEWITKAHHGRVQVESEVGKGTTFHVFLPLWEPPDSP